MHQNRLEAVPGGEVSHCTRNIPKGKIAEGNHDHAAEASGDEGVEEYERIPRKGQPETGRGRVPAPSLPIKTFDGQIVYNSQKSLGAKVPAAKVGDEVC